MVRFLFYIKNLYFNKVLNIFMILQFCFIILVINATVSSVLYDSSANNYISNYSENIYLLSGAIKSNINFGDKDSFFKLINDISKIEGVESVGYQLEESLLISGNEDIRVDSLFLNEGLTKVKYPLIEGEWFKNKKNEFCEIIIGGNISRDYGIGDNVILFRQVFVNNKVEYIEFPAIIIGKLKNPSFIIELGYSSNRPSFNNLFEPSENIILTNNDIILDSNDIRYPLESLIIHIDESKKEEVIQQLENYGQVINFKDIENISNELLLKNIISKIPPNLIMLSAVFFGVIGITYLIVFKSMKYLAIYYLCGMDKKLCKNLIFFQNTFNICMGFILALILMQTNVIQELLFRRGLMGLWNLIVCMIFYIFVLFTSYICSFILSNSQPISMIRRFE